MSGFPLRSLIVATSLGALVTGRSAIAFDPFTAAAVVNAGAQVVSVISDTTGEITAGADAFSELYGEIDSDAAVSVDGRRMVQDIQEIESLARDAGYSKEEVEQLTTDAKGGQDGKTLATTLKAITRAVRAGKNVAKLVMKLDKKAQLAQVEQAATQREQLLAIYKQISREHARDLETLKEKLKDLKDRRDQIATLKKEEKSLGAMSFGRSGVLTFPKQDSVIEEAIRMAIQMRPYLLQLVLFAFLSRALFYQFGFYGSSPFGELLRDGIVCALLMTLFPELVRAAISLSNGLAANVGLKELRDVEPAKLDFSAGVGLSFKTRLALEWAFQWIKYAAFVTAGFLANFGLAFLIILLPLVIFCSQMLGFAVAWPIFLGGFLAICLWPLFWNTTGSIALMLWRKQDTTIKDQIATVLFSLLQFFSPLLGIAVLKGQPLAKSAKHAVGAVSGLTSALFRQMSGFAKGAVGSEGGGGLGRTLAYPVNQMAGRMVAAGLRGNAAAQGAGQIIPKSKIGTRSPALGRVLKASAAGFMTNQAKGPNRGGAVATTLRTLQGLGRKPILHGTLSAKKFTSESQTRSPSQRSPVIKPRK